MTVYKTITINVCHQLRLNYPSVETNLHGHSLRIDVYLEGAINDSTGMVVDQATVEYVLKGYDHRVLNEIIAQPTMELLALQIKSEMEENFSHCKAKVRIWEGTSYYVET